MPNSPEIWLMMSAGSPACSAMDRSEVQIGTLLLNCASDLTDLVGGDVFLRQRLQLVKSVGVQMVANDLLTSPN